MTASVVFRGSLPFEVVEVLAGTEAQLARFAVEDQARRFARSMQRGGGAQGYRYYVARVVCAECYQEISHGVCRCALRTIGASDE